ncbi:MAG: hypothetical protein JWM30_2244, partial [Burkholderia sp.]|nr:hypothetical protein [Burkholderia sp.]
MKWTPPSFSGIMMCQGCQMG